MYMKTSLGEWVSKARHSSSMAASLNGHPVETKICIFFLKRPPKLREGLSWILVPGQNSQVKGEEDMRSWSRDEALELGAFLGAKC